MEVSRSSVSYALPSRLRRIVLAARWNRSTSLSRHLVLILLFKVALLGILWFAFFRAPAAPHMRMEAQRVEVRLIGGPTTPEATHAVP
jgi:hypothetical protein